MKPRFAAALVASLFAAVSLTAASAPTPAPASGAEGARVLSIDHYVRVKSTAPSMPGQFAQLYVRERVAARHAEGGAAGVVLFVHGAGTPAEVAFDTPHPGYSWMAYLADAGFDVFSMDMEGYGRSTRPTAMNDPANLTPAQQAQFIPGLLAAPAERSFQGSVTTVASDWNDIAAVVAYLRSLRRVERVSLVGWSQGGPRAGGYAAQHPEQIERLILFAPAYARNGSATPPASFANATVFNTQNQKEFEANWDRQVSCADQFDPAVRAAVWADMLASDPVGRTWGTGVRRAPNVPTWGFNQAVVSASRTPTLMFAGALDVQVTPARVRELYDDLGATEKIFVELACSSHNAQWERNRLHLFAASLEWLQRGTVNGLKTGVLKLGSGEAAKKN